MSAAVVRLEGALRDHGWTPGREHTTALAIEPVLQALVERGDGDPVPSVREIADKVGVSASSTIRHHLRTLAFLGLVKLPAPGTPRSVTVTDAGRELLRRADHCDPSRGYHSTPHKRCILR